jgi:hypothetical protein
MKKIQHVSKYSGPIHTPNVSMDPTAPRKNTSPVHKIF